jgi:hypothetical protein
MKILRTNKFRCNSSVRSFSSPDWPPKFLLFGVVAEFASDPSEINHLQGRIPPATGLNRRFLLFFRVEQGNSVVVLEAPGLPSKGRAPRHGAPVVPA